MLTGETAGGMGAAVAACAAVRRLGVTTLKPQCIRSSFLQR